MARTTKVSKDTAAKPAKKPARKPARKPADKAAASTAKTKTKPPAVKSAARKAPARKPVAKKPVKKTATMAADVVKKATATPVIKAVKQPPKNDAPKTDTPSPAKGKPAVKVKSETPNPASGGKPAGADLVPLPKSPPTPVKPGIMPMVLGGAAAAAIGFGAAFFIQPKPTGNAANIEQILGQQDAALKALKSDVAALSGGTDQSQLEESLSDNNTAITGLTGRLNAIGNQIGALGARLTALENRPAPAPTQSPDAANSVDIAALRAALAEQKAQLEAMAARTAEQDKIANAGARATLRRAALTRVRTALDNGLGFAPALADLEETGVVIPAALSAVAGSGVASLAQLQESFPDAARAALSAARTAASETGAGGFGAFLRDQLGARALEPQEGNDPDAILSRVEAATRENRLTDALAELQALPEVARVELSDWAGDVARRLEAQAAAEQLDGE